MRIDAHQHFWAVARGDYGWLKPELTTLYRDFQPNDLTPILQAQGIEGTVLVQAAPKVAETEYMLELAAAHDFIKGVVGWVDFESPDAVRTIETQAANPKLVGLRPMIQDIPDPDWVLRPELRPAFEAAVAHDLVFDALTFPRHLPNLRKLIARHPGLRVVIDHGSKPRIAAQEIDGWAADMRAIADESAAYVKLSGLVTEAGPEWTVDDLKPYVEVLLDSFGPDRVVWGSDWPVCTLASSYERWCDATESLLSHLEDRERAAILGLNAVRLYRLATGP